jgi:hypothetical protein
MKIKKIFFKTNILLIILGLVSTGYLLQSCDDFEADKDVLSPEVNVKEEALYLQSNNLTFIDLSKRIQTSQPVKLSITSTPKYGNLVDLGQGLLQYNSSVSFKGDAREKLEFSVYNSKNEIILKDTIIIIIENDTTDLPCGIYPAADHVYGVEKDKEFSVNVLENDYFCNYDSTDLIVTILQLPGEKSITQGTAIVSDQTIVYTAGSTFSGQDQVIYKVQPRSNKNIAAYGSVYFSTKRQCENSAFDDVYTFDVDTLMEGVDLPVLLNDSLCATIGEYEVSVSRAPKFGEVKRSPYGFIYRLTDPTATSDDFDYKECMNGRCTIGRVTITIKSNSICLFYARPDEFIVSTTESYFDVLKNDTKCENDFIGITITEPPVNGKVSITDKNLIYYKRDLQLTSAPDSLRYKICRGMECSETSVLITVKK